MHLSRRSLFVRVAAAMLLAALAGPAMAQKWTEPVRGSWVHEGEARAGDVVLADEAGVAEIVLAETAGSIMRRAAAFLAGDIEKITGQRPAIVPRPSGGRKVIWLVTLGEGANLAQLPEGIDAQAVAGKHEA